MESDVVKLPLSDKLWAWFHTNKRQTIWGATIVVAVGLIVWFVVYQRDQKEAAASDALSRVTATQLAAAPGARSEMAAEYLKVAATYPNSAAGKRAVLLAAGSLFSEGKYDEAKTQFQRLLRENPGGPFTGQALLGIAACLDAQGKASEAITAYEDLVKRHPSETVIPDAKLALARLYEAQNKPELARNYLEEVAQGGSYGSLASEAFMRLEALKAKYPNLAPSASSPISRVTSALTNAPAQATNSTAPKSATATSAVPAKTGGSK